MPETLIKRTPIRFTGDTAKPDEIEKEFDNIEKQINQKIATKEELSEVSVKADALADMVLGEISVVGNSTQTAIAVAGTAVQVTIFDTETPKNGTSPSILQNHILVTKEGMYLIMVSATVNSLSGAASRFEMTVQKNNGAAAVGALHCDRNLSGGGGEAGVISMSGLAILKKNDTIEVWLENETNTQNYIVEDISLTIIKVGT